jgi:hypothetical protein
MQKQLLEAEQAVSSLLLTWRRLETSRALCAQEQQEEGHLQAGAAASGRQRLWQPKPFHSLPLLHH